MTQKPDGGPAYPQLETCGDMTLSMGGMTLRDHFAGQALAGIAGTYNGTEHAPTAEAIIAYKYADAMIAARDAK